MVLLVCDLNNLSASTVLYFVPFSIDLDKAVHVEILNKVDGFTPRISKFADPYCE